MSVVSAYYYLRVVVAMYMRDPVGEDVWAPVGIGAATALTVRGGDGPRARRLPRAGPGLGPRRRASLR